MLRAMLIAGFLILVVGIRTGEAARCTGSSSCRACSTCSSCAHCAKGGGSCGVCSGGGSSSRSDYGNNESGDGSSWKPVGPRTRERSRFDLPLPQSLSPEPLKVGEAQHAAAASATPQMPPNTFDASQAMIAVYFSPNGGCEQAIIDALEKAHTEVRVQAYYFTNPRIASAVRQAHQRNVHVTILLDASQQSIQYSSADYFANGGINTRIDRNHPISHSKIILIDDDTIITGSFNFTKAAEDSNEENLLVIRNMPELFAAYAKHFDEHLAHSVPYAGKLAGSSAVSPKAPTPAGSAVGN